jgi:hypothetical protein
MNPSTDTNTNTDAAVGEESGGVFRSGIAARLAGIPVNTLRVWERRYSLVEPNLSSGRQRLYSREDVRRLALIKQVVDLGHPIGSVANLENAALLSILETGFPASSRRSFESTNVHGEPYRIALVGSMLAAQPWRQTFAGRNIEIVASCTNRNSAANILRGVAVDLLIIDIPVLSDVDVDAIASLKATAEARMIAVLYRYASTVIIRRLRAMGHAVARATSDSTQIEALCFGLLRPHDRVTHETKVNKITTEAGQAPPPRFSDKELVFLSALPSKIACECPRNIVDLVVSLRSFEMYSAECVVQNARDAELHRELQGAAGHARSIMEQALGNLIEVEGISLPDGEVGA